MKLVRIPFLALAYGSVVTLVAEAALLGVLFVKGKLNEGTIVQLLAISQDVDLDAIRHQLEDRARPADVEQISFDEVLAARRQVALDLDLKEIATDKGLIDVRQLDLLFDQERKEYDALKQDFDNQLEKLRQGAVDESLKEVQRQLESVDPKLAKDQLLRILDDPDLDPQATMQFVVTMFKAMPLDKRKRILAEFKSEADIQRLHEILRQIRLGVPDVEVFRQTRKQLEAFNSRF